jgi:hypothetical protein
MADKKISSLPPSALPLAGTEVLPIVQSGATTKVATDDLTVKNVRSNATTGILQVSGPAVGATRVMTVPDANFTAARTDAANSLSGDQTLSNGNLIVGTSGKGIDFSANSNAAGMTSELLTWYEEGTWTGTLTGFGAAPTTPVTTTGRYTRIGRTVTIQIVFNGVNTTGASGVLLVTGLPFTNSAQVAPGPCYLGGMGAVTAAMYIQASDNRISFINASTASYVDIVAGSGKYVGGSVTYTV